MLQEKEILFDDPEELTNNFEYINNQLKKGEEKKYNNYLLFFNIINEIILYLIIHLLKNMSHREFILFEMCF